MNILAFNGSPRAGGNAESLLLAALKPLQEAGHAVTIVQLNELRVTPCQDCGGCVKTGICTHHDDMDAIYQKIREADRVILASPVFFYSVSAQAKAMIDRCQSFWCEKYLLKREIPAGSHGRKGLFLLVGGMNKDECRQTTEPVVKGFFRTISIPRHETLFYGGIDGKGDIQKHPTAFLDAAAAAIRLAS